MEFDKCDSTPIQDYDVDTAPPASDLSHQQADKYPEMVHIWSLHLHKVVVKGCHV